MIFSCIWIISVWSNLSSFFFFLIASDFTVIGSLVVTLLDRSQSSSVFDQKYGVEKE